MSEQTAKTLPSYEQITESQPSKRGLVYQNGTLWFPVKKVTRTDESAQTTIIQPLFRKQDFGGMMPVVIIKIPDVWDSTIIPYENIVSFQLTTIAGKGTEGNALQATLTFLDQTPIFIEELVRKAYRKRVSDAQQVPFKLRFGWRLGRSISPQVIDAFSLYGNVVNNMILSDEYELFLISGTWKYSNFGVMIDLTLTYTPKSHLSNVSLDSFNMDIMLKRRFTEINPDEHTKQDLLGIIMDTLTDIINTVVGKGLRYKCLELPGSKIDATSTFQKLLKYNSSGNKYQSALDFLEDITNYMVADRTETLYGKVGVWVSPTPIKQLDIYGNEQAVYPIYFYEAYNAHEVNEYIPQIIYPDYESPIINFQPELVVENPLIFENRKRMISDSGKETTVKEGVGNTPAIASKPSPDVGTSVPLDAPSVKQDGQPKETPAYATLKITIPGDPLFNDINVLFTTFEVIHKDIRQEGVLKIRDDYFANFKGLNDTFRDDLRKTLEKQSNQVFKGMPASQSPFSGVYHLMGVTHKIAAGSGYQTDLDFVWSFESFSTPKSGNEIREEQRKKEEENARLQEEAKKEKERKKNEYLERWKKAKSDKERSEIKAQAKAEGITIPEKRK